MSKQRIFIAGHRGMVGSAIRRQLEQRGDVELVLRTRDELNLLDSRAVHDFFASERIDQVYLAAAKVGGIVANNTYPADFIYQNMMIESNIIHAAHQNDVNKLLFLGSSCIYPKLAKQPMAESELLQGTLEPTNEPYAIAKIAGIKLCESYNRQYGRDYRSVMPTNLYGPHDNFHPSNSHVIPALLRRFHEATAQNAPDVVVWGSGTPMREFLHVDDMAAASIHVMELAHEVWLENTQPMLSHINVGTGVDCTIRELAQTIAATFPVLDPQAYGGRKPYIVFTGGEPALQLTRELIDRLHALGFELGVESNGTLPLPEGLDWITVSPKGSNPLATTSGHELKLVWPQQGCSPEDFEELDFRHFLLQPCDDPRNKANTRECIAYCLLHPRWSLGLQTHKWVGVR